MNIFMMQNGSIPLSRPEMTIAYLKQNSDADLIHFKKHTKSVDRTIKGLALRVPLQIESHPPFQIIDLVRIGTHLGFIDQYTCPQFRLDPTQGSQDGREALRDSTFVATADDNVVLRKTEFSQSSAKFGKDRGELTSQDGCGVTVIVDLVEICEIGWHMLIPRQLENSRSATDIHPYG